MVKEETFASQISLLSTLKTTAASLMEPVESIKKQTKHENNEFQNVATIQPELLNNSLKFFDYITILEYGEMK